MKQPFSYQTLPCSCWVTSVTNGLLHIYGDKNRIPGFALRLLHSVLTDEGVHNSYGKSEADWEIVLAAVAKKCGFKIKVHSKEKAEKALLNADFSKSAVICDIGYGSHSILITGSKDGWFYGFDPDWDNVIADDEKPDEYVLFPSENKLDGRVNFKVHQDHLFLKKTTKNRRFSMGGVAERHVVVISKKSKKKPA